MRTGYKFLEHTADIMVEAAGIDFASAIEQACMAMFEVIGSDKAEEKIEYEITETADTKEELVVYFLSSILAEAEISEVLPSKVKVEINSQKPFKIKAKLWGEKIMPKDHIKAVTFHELLIKEQKDGCIIRVLFDV